MKRALLVVAVLVAAAFLISQAAYAAPVGNISAPCALKSYMLSCGCQGKCNGSCEGDVFGIIAGGDFDYIFEKNLDFEDDEDIDVDTEIAIAEGKMGVVIARRFIAYGLLGAGKIKHDISGEGTSLNLESDTDLVWGVGGTLLLWQTTLCNMDNSILSFGVDGKYRRLDFDISDATLDGITADISELGMNVNLNEWQVALGVSLQMANFIPYVGVKYSDVSGELTIEDESDKVDIDAEDNVGVFVGADLMMTDWLSLNVEGRFIDETAVNGGATVRF